MTQTAEERLESQKAKVAKELARLRKMEAQEKERKKAEEISRKLRLAEILEEAAGCRIDENAFAGYCRHYANYLSRINTVYRAKNGDEDF